VVKKRSLAYSQAADITRPYHRIRTRRYYGQGLGIRCPFSPCRKFAEAGGPVTLLN